MLLCDMSLVLGTKAPDPDSTLRIRIRLALWVRYENRGLDYLKANWIVIKTIRND